MIVVKNVRFVTDNKMVRCTMDYYVLLNGVPENRPELRLAKPVVPRKINSISRSVWTWLMSERM